MTMVRNIDVESRLRRLVERHGCKPAARAASMAPQTIEAALRGEPLRISTWEKIEKTINKILTTEIRDKITPIIARRGGRETIFDATGVSRSTIASLLAGRRVQSTTLDRLIAAMPAIEKTAEKRGAKRCSLCDRPSERERCWRCCNKSSKHCQRCGHPHKDELSSAFCCLLVPESRGHCGWCGDDCERPFCGKPCSIAYHSDRTGGLVGEGMTSESVEIRM